MVTRTKKSKTKSNASGERSYGNNTLAAPFADACILAVIRGDIKTFKKLHAAAKKYRKGFDTDFVFGTGSTNGATTIKTRGGLDHMANELPDDSYLELRNYCLEYRS